MASIVLNWGSMKKTLYSNEHNELRKLLKQVRLGAGLRQEDLARLVGKPQSFISKCESGERCLDLLELRQVCQAVGVPLKEFVNRLEESLK